MVFFCVEQTIILLLKKISKNNVKRLKEIFTKNIRDQKDFNFTFSQLEKYEIKKDCLVFAKKYLIKSESILVKYNNKQSKLLKDLLVSSIERQD